MFKFKFNSRGAVPVASCPGLVWLLLAGLGGAAQAAPADSERQERYQQERQACLDGRSQQSRADCLQEAQAARAEPRSSLGRSNPEQERSNQTRRCQGLPERDRAREDCLSRMTEPSARHGSVESGGIYREWSRPEVAPARP